MDRPGHRPLPPPGAARGLPPAVFLWSPKALFWRGEKEEPELGPLRTWGQKAAGSLKEHWTEPQGSSRAGSRWHWPCDPGHAPLGLEGFPSVKQAAGASSSRRSLPVHTLRGSSSWKAVCNPTQVVTRAPRVETAPLPAPAPAGGNSLRCPRGAGSRRGWGVGGTCGSESSALWWRPGRQAASRRRRPNGCDSGVAPLQGCGSYGPTGVPSWAEPRCN